jgi:hypothetical protein
MATMGRKTCGDEECDSVPTSAPFVYSALLKEALRCEKNTRIETLKLTHIYLRIS